MMYVQFFRVEMLIVTMSVSRDNILIIILLWTKLCNAIGIYNGTPADISEYPSQVCIKYVKRNGISDQLCGGSIINAWHVLTSCHCFKQSETISYPAEFVVAGDSLWDDSSMSSSRQQRSIELVVTHPWCKYRGAKHVDVAICRVNESFVQIGSSLMTIPIAKVIPPAGTSCVIVGWGQDETGEKSRYLRKALTTVSAFHKCGSYYFDDDKYVCASSPTGYQTPCYGDCGGPLICNNELVGILEGGHGICGKKTYGNYYTFVGKYMHWVNSVSSWSDVSVPPHDKLDTSVNAMKKIRAKMSFNIIIVFIHWCIN